MRPSISKELHRLQTILHRLMKQTIPAELNDSCQEISGANGRIIRFLRERDNLPTYQKDIEQEFSVTRSTASRVLALMERKELLTRKGVAHDARLKQVLLTDKARTCDDIMRQCRRDLEDKLLRGFSDAELDQLLSFLCRMRENITDESTQRRNPNE